MLIDTDKPVKVISYGRVTQKTGHWHSGRSLDTDMLVCVVKGSLDMEIGERLYSACDGDILLVPAGVRYAPKDADGLEYYFIHFSAESGRPGKSDDLCMRANPFLPEGDYEYYCCGGNTVIEIMPLSRCGDQPQVRSILRQIAELNIWNNPTDKLILDSLARQLLIIISKGAANKQVGRLLGEIITYIGENLTAELGLSALSLRFGVSQSYIARCFTKELGTTASDYTARVRCAEACRLLVCTGMSVYEIAYAVGFKDQYYFSRVFKKIYGVAPGGFRKRAVPSGL